MMKKITAILACACVFTAGAEPAWISDALQTSVSDKPEVNGKFLGSVNAGEPVTLLGMSDDGRYAHIKTDKLDGWVWARNIMKSPSIQVKFAEQQQALNQAQSQNAQLSNISQSASQEVQQLQAQLAQAQDSAQKSRAELAALQRASANVVQIDQRNRELQAQVVALEQENLNLRHNNSRLEESKSQKQMTIGGILVIAGFLLSGLVSLMRRSGRRHSFDDL